MASPTDSPGPEQGNLQEVSPGSSAIIASEVKDLEKELRAVKRKATWHYVWTLLGISPAAIIPALGLARDGSQGLLILLFVLVMLSQSYLGAKASKKAQELEAALEKLKEGE